MDITFWWQRKTTRSVTSGKQYSCESDNRYKGLIRGVLKPPSECEIQDNQSPEVNPVIFVLKRSGSTRVALLCVCLTSS